MNEQNEQNERKAALFEFYSRQVKSDQELYTQLLVKVDNLLRSVRASPTADETIKAANAIYDAMKKCPASAAAAVQDKRAAVFQYYYGNSTVPVQFHYGHFHGSGWSFDKREQVLAGLRDLRTLILNPS